MNTIYFNSFDTDSMGFTYDEYKAYCKDNNEEPTDAGFYDWTRWMLETEWDDVLFNLKHYDRENYGHYYISGSLGLWNGRNSVYRVMNSLEDAVYACVENMDYCSVKDEDGVIYVTGIHHDGRNTFEIRRMTEDSYEEYVEKNGLGEEIEFDDNKDMVAIDLAA